MKQTLKILTLLMSILGGSISAHTSEVTFVNTTGNAIECEITKWSEKESWKFERDKKPTAVITLNPHTSQPILLEINNTYSITCTSKENPNIHDNFPYWTITDEKLDQGEKFYIEQPSLFFPAIVGIPEIRQPHIASQPPFPVESVEVQVPVMPPSRALPAEPIPQAPPPPLSSSAPQKQSPKERPVRGSQSQPTKSPIPAEQLEKQKQQLLSPEESKSRELAKWAEKNKDLVLHYQKMHKIDLKSQLKMKITQKKVLGSKNALEIIVMQNILNDQLPAYVPKEQEQPAELPEEIPQEWL